MKIIDDSPVPAEALSAFIRSIFDVAVAPAFAPEGVAEFYRYIVPSAITARQNNGHFMLFALDAEHRLAGVIEIRNADHISLLFVRLDCQRQGIGKALFTAALQKSQSNRSDLTAFQVNASPTAVAAYEGLGFTITGAEQLKNGIRFVPMAYPVGATPNAGDR